MVPYESDRDVSLGSAALCGGSWSLCRRVFFIIPEAAWHMSNVCSAVVVLKHVFLIIL